MRAEPSPGMAPEIGLVMWESDGRITKILEEKTPKTGKYPPIQGTILMVADRFRSVPPSI
ncbi:MAG TPA: hypothetical protein DCS85_08445 [Verrucomicrobiales bacterium]|nr:hypothetical protein [Deltaproteobacteria bacterium]HAT20169.1 hypothetical protein [Verrucomicrobiales bacterium]